LLRRADKDLQLALPRDLPAIAYWVTVIVIAADVEPE
jgi:hypothetical protein